MSELTSTESGTAESDLVQKARMGVAWSLLQNVGRHGANFVIFLLLAKLLQPNDFGLVAMAGVYVALVNVLIEQGLGEALVQRLALDDDHLSTAFWLNLALAALAAGVTLLGAPQVASFYGRPELAEVLRALAMLFPLTALTTVQQARLQRLFAFRALAVRTLTAVMAGGVAGTALAASGFGVWSLVGQQLCAGLVGVLVIWRSAGWRPRLAFSPAHARELLGFSRSVLSVNILNFVSRKGDDLLIGLFLGPVALGLYSVAYQIFTAVEQLLCQGLDAVALAGFSRLQQQAERLRAAYYRAVKTASLAVLPAFAGVALVAPEFVSGVLGRQWLPAVTVIQWLACAGVLHGLFHLNHAVFKACGQPGVSLRLMLVNAGANLLLFVVVVRWGIEAVAAAYVLRAYLLAPLGLWALRRMIGVSVKTYLLQLRWPMLATLAMVGVLLGLKSALPPLAPAAALALFVLAGVIVYATVLWVFARQYCLEVADLVRVRMPRR
jgi:PST family polysaccharide transporter